MQWIITNIELLHDSRLTNLKRFSLLLSALLTSAIVAFIAGCTNEKNSARDKSKKVTTDARSSFEINLPTDVNWKRVRDGDFKNLDNSYWIAVIDKGRDAQLYVMVLPSLPHAPTLKSMKLKWERGFLENATEKISSEDICLSGYEGYKITAAVDAENGKSFQVVGILIVANGWNYTIGITLPKDATAEKFPEVQEFLDSFRIVPNQEE